MAEDNRRIVNIIFLDGTTEQIEYKEGMDVGNLLQEISDRRNINIVKLVLFIHGNENQCNYADAISCEISYFVMTKQNIHVDDLKKYVPYIVQQNYDKYIEHPREHILTIITFYFSDLIYHIKEYENMEKRVKFYQKFNQPFKIAEDLDYLVENINEYEYLVENYLLYKPCGSETDKTYDIYLYLDDSDKLTIRNYLASTIGTINISNC